MVHILCTMLQLLVNVSYYAVAKQNRHLLYTHTHLFDRFNKGDVLVTTSTGEMSDEEAERAGLVTSHAYAMLDIKEVKGVKFFQLKNPWNHLRWKGR